MGDSPRGPGFVIFTICWLALQAFTMVTIGSAVQDGSGDLAGLLAFAGTGIVLVFAYLGLLALFWGRERGGPEGDPGEDA